MFFSYFSPRVLPLHIQRQSNEPRRRHFGIGAQEAAPQICESKLPALRVAATPSHLRPRGSPPMDGITVVAARHIRPKRCAQPGPWGFCHRWPEVLL